MNYFVNFCALINVATNATIAATELQTQTQPQKRILKCTFLGLYVDHKVNSYVHLQISPQVHLIILLNRPLTAM